MQTILAKSKSKITLAEHTKGLLEQIENLVTILKNKGIDCDLLKIAIFTHDLGKISPTFQVSVGNWNYSPKIPFPDVPHSLFSLLWIDKQKLSNYLSNNDDIKLLLSVIAFHHWRDNFDNIILGRDEEFINAVKQVLQNDDFRDRLLQNLKVQFSSEDFKKYIDILGFDEDIARAIQERNDLFSYVIPPYYNYFLPQRITLNEEFKKKWIYTAGLLMRVDHFTSYVQEESIEENIEKPVPHYETIENKFKTILKNKFKEDKELWQLEVLKDKKNDNLILVAPTGSGKTEFAYLWGAGSKLIFTLPLRSAVNAIYERTIDIFGQENVGLLHSDADVYLYEKSINHEGESFKVLDLARHLSLPVLVSTGDQLFPSALKYPCYEKIYSTLGYSKLVIDEVQAYDPRAVAIIVKLIEDVVKLGGKFLLMTATLPPIVKEQIEKRVGKENFEPIDRYSQYGNISKHKIEMREGDILNKIDEMLEKATKENKRVLVILNTVESAQAVYKKIKDANKDNIYLKLLHSRFTLNDRKNLENEIVGAKDKKGTFSNPKPDNEQEGKIIIATQVIEASLDIDADILYTELAPIDSLVQRMGRVLRRVKDQESYQKYLDSQESTVPNIFIFYQKPDGSKKLCSGAGSVYQNDLLAFSLALLFTGARPELITESKITELKNKYWLEKKEKKEKAKDALKCFLEDLFETVDTVRAPQTKGRGKNKKIETQKTLIFSISETNKQKLVEGLYNLLPLGSGYLQRFYETLDILDAGYMSDRKHEALKLFREIYTVPAIPEGKIEEFKMSIEDFLNNDKFSYTLFKIEVLAEYVVNIDIRKYFYNNSLNLKDASYLAYEIEGRKEQINRISRIKKWLRGIYVFDGEYNKDLGISSEKTSRKNEIYSSGII
jgi:CRISPR-associated endonuclease/helicase Cas3